MDFIIIKLQCNKCNTKFEIRFDNKNEDNSYYAVCPNCGNRGYKALNEVSSCNYKKKEEV